MLIPMQDHMGDVEELKLSMGYGVPKSYPLALNGMGEVRIGVTAPSAKTAYVFPWQSMTRGARVGPSSSSSSDDQDIGDEGKYTTYAVIGGAVVVAGILAMAVRKSRKK